MLALHRFPCMANGNIVQTERDFAEIAGAGLSWIRLVMPFWMVETIEGEPYVEGIAWKYVLKGVAWARKYGLRVKLDLHTIPGSQNAWNHSGRQGSCNFLNGTNGIFNAQRTLNYIRTITEFFHQPEYRDVVQMFGIINEPQVGMQGNETLSQFYLEAYNEIRSITGTGEGNGMWIAFHDGFRGLPGWAGFLSGSDRAAMDQHNYLAFSTPSNDSLGYTAGKPCSYWAVNYNNSMNNFGFSFSGEFSLAVTDCGEYLNNVGNGARYDGTYIAPGSTVSYGLLLQRRCHLVDVINFVTTDTDISSGWQLRRMEQLANLDGRAQVGFADYCFSGDGRCPELVLLDLEDRQQHKDRLCAQSHVELQGRHGAGLDAYRSTSPCWCLRVCDRGTGVCSAGSNSHIYRFSKSMDDWWSWRRDHRSGSNRFIRRLATNKHARTCRSACH